jgi:hypothetical protein
MNDNILKALNLAFKVAHSSQIFLFYKFLEPENFHYIWITSARDYENITERLSNLKINDIKKHVVICQGEEDWFENCNYFQVRKNIKNHPVWTDQSFIITNSRQDKEQTKSMGINAVCRPPISDLITYRPYDLSIVNHKNITHYTGSVWARVDQHRLDLWNLFNQYRNKIIVSKFNSEVFNCSVDKNNFVIDNLHNDADITCLINTINAPYQNIESDSPWINRTAFGSVIETRHSAVLGPNKLKIFTPTLTEKTYRNMHFLRPAVICGGQGTRRYLKDLGFDTWDWFVDWSFDLEANDAIRFQKFLQEIERLLNTPLRKLIDLVEENQDKLLYNRQRLFYLINNYDTIDI